MKKLILIMGTYGSGKTTFYNTLFNAPTNEDFIYINVADRVKNKINDVGIKHIAYQLTNDSVINELKNAVEKSQNVILETTFASTYTFDDISILKNFKDNNYKIEGYFLYMSDVKDNINNKLVSYLRGDSIHVDDDTIVRHYNKSLENIEKYSVQFDKLYLLDNSSFEMETKTILKNEKINNIDKYYNNYSKSKKIIQGLNSNLSDEIIDQLIISSSGNEEKIKSFLHTNKDISISDIKNFFGEFQKGIEPINQKNQIIMNK
jgi:predicted ABC-type ATPase